MGRENHAVIEAIWDQLVEDESRGPKTTEVLRHELLAKIIELVELGPDILKEIKLRLNHLLQNVLASGDNNHPGHVEAKVEVLSN